MSQAFIIIGGLFGAIVAVTSIRRAVLYLMSNAVDLSDR